MTTRNNPSSSRKSRRRIAVLGAMGVSVAAAITLSLSGSAPAKDEAPAYRPEVVESVNRYAELHGLSGLSPASMGQQAQTSTGSCHGLSPASAQDCSAEDIEQAFGR
jgi:hypothetical protein